MTEYVETVRKIKKIESIEDFEGILDKLTISPRQKEIMMLRYFKKLSFYDIADQVGYSRSAALWNHREVVNKMKKFLP